MSLELRRHADAEAFLAEALEPLEAAETANNLILGVPLGLRLHPERSAADAYFATVHADGALVAAALRTPPHHLVVHVEDAATADGDAVIARLLQDARSHAGDLNGVNGRVPWPEHFAHAWVLQTGGQARLGTRLRAYELRAVIAPPTASGALRKAGPADAASAVEFSLEFWDEVMGDDPGRPSPESIERKLGAGEIYFWEDDGAPVCLVAKSRPMPHGVTLGPVYTPPALRGRGYAAACTAAVSELLLDAGWAYCALFTDLDYPASNRVYEKIGFQPVCDYADYHFAAG